MARGKGSLQIISAGESMDIKHLSCHIYMFTDFGFHGGWIDFFHRYAAGSDNGF